MELNKLTAHELIEKLNKKEIASKDIIFSLSQRIKTIDDKVRAYVRFSDSILASPQLPSFPASQPLLNDIPVSIKDNLR